MAKIQGKIGLKVKIAILVTVLLVLGIFLIAKNANQKSVTKIADTSKNTPSVTKNTSTTETDATDTTTPAPVSNVDPSTLATIDVAPLGITVSYTKGLGAFGFEVKKTADQTQYVDFSTDGLVGTKCTNDVGLFALIIKNPSPSEVQGTITQTTKVGKDTYGLSLAGKGCTNNPVLLDQFQTAFTNGFPSLKAL